MARWFDSLQEHFYRVAASGWLPRRLFARDIPRSEELPERVGKLNLEIVSHCWNYAKFLRYQLSSLVLYPPTELRVRATVFYCPEDKQTVELLNFFAAQQVPNVSWNWQPLEKPRLLRRAIGRNIACLDTEADWIWLNDCDQMFYRGCLDALADALQGRRDFLVYPRNVRHTELLEDDHPLLNAAGDLNAIVTIDPDDFIPAIHTRAVGACQIVHGDVARRMGYCRDAPYYLRPVEGVWRKTTEDRAFRWLLGTQGTPLDVPGLYRIEHAHKGRYETDGKSSWLGEKATAARRKFSRMRNESTNRAA